MRGSSLNRDATLRDIAKWQADMYIYSCWLYANDYETVLDDCSYDQVVLTVEYYWDWLPDALKERVPKDTLKDGSSIHLAAGGWTVQDQLGAFEWFKRVRGRWPNKL